MRDDLLRRLEPTVEALGYELVDLEFIPQGRASVLRIFIDRPQGIGLEDCATVSRAVSELLDVDDPIPGQYNLEVSSPGLDRVLRKRTHYERFVGSRVHVQLMSPLAGRRRFTGALQTVGEEGVTVEVDGQPHVLPYKLIQRTRLVPA